MTIRRCDVLPCVPCLVRWLQVEAEANPEVSEKLEIATVPTFVLLKVFYYATVHVLLISTLSTLIWPSFY